jgi:hypothetical protein
MLMIGQGSPRSNFSACAARIAATVLFCACWSFGLAAHGAPLEVRLRIAWGSGGQSPRQWHGRITVADAAFSSLQPLGIEADEAAALRLEDAAIVVSPLVDRTFDGCDVTVRGDETATLKFELRSSTSPHSPIASIETSVAEAAQQPFTASLDAAGAGLLVHRAPGDKLRVKFKRDHLIFTPNEEFSIGVVADLQPADGANPLYLEAKVVRAGQNEVLWSTTATWKPRATEPIPFVLNAPLSEGVYRLRLSAGHRQAGLAKRLTPWETPTVVASREIEFVVVDSEKSLPRLTQETTLVETLDPVSSSWWQRIPQWTQVDKLPAFATPRPLGNIKPQPVSGSKYGMVELPAAVDGEPAWQAYVLPIRAPDEPYAVEVELPQDRQQQIALSVIEPDAAGRVTMFGRDSSAVVVDRVGGTSTATGAVVHRIDFWPKSRSPVLLVANQSGNKAAQFGKIRLLRRSVAAAEPNGKPTQPQRLVAAYIGAPQFADAFGGAEELDATSGLSVDGWNKFLLGAERLAQQLRAAGYNAAIVSIAANGSSLAPIAALGSSPRYDTGLLSGAGVDPVRKDVLELLLRIFDREGLRLIPAIQLTTPLAGLEAKRAGRVPQQDGFEWIGGDGRRWAEHRGPAAEAPHYNLLNRDVQAGVGEIVEQLTTRYGQHPSLAGVAIQLSSAGFGVLPGLAWGFDDATAERFAGVSGIAFPSTGDDRFEKRAALALGPHREQWLQWRTSETSEFYARLAELLRRERAELTLVLCTEELFAGADAILDADAAARASREMTLAELGVDAQRLSETPGVTLLRSRRLGVERLEGTKGLPLRAAAAESDRRRDDVAHGGELHYRPSMRLRLSSFDAQSPFGASATHLSLQAPTSVVGDASRGMLATALAQRDLTTLLDGGESFFIAHDDQYGRLLRIIQELPLGAEVRTERRQPITLRVYREADATTACLVNESPWPVTVELPLTAEAAMPWRRLGEDFASSGAKRSAAATGTLPGGSQTWKIDLPAFSIEARRFADRGLKVGAFEPVVSDAARAALEARVGELEQRMRSLDVEREYLVLDNPGFEMAVDAARSWGWEPRVGEAGAVDVDSTTARSGSQSLHLQSETPLGVAAQSQQFPAPDTGQLAVRAHVRTRGLAPDARLYAWMEYEVDGKPQQRYRELGNSQTLSDQWTECEFALDDLPTGEGLMRVQFHLAGQGEAWVDDVRLHDLQFSESQRVELFKRLYAATAALDEGRLVDCERLVDGQWARHLMEHVPRASMASNVPASSTPAVASESESKGFGSRIRDIVPRVWR